MLDAGSKLGPYEILASIGVGGMGEVYRARDPRLRRDVAIKVLRGRHADSREFLARFETEARAVAAISHPNIVALFDYGSADGVTYAVSELLEGETLRQRLASGPLPERKALEVAVQIARGLAAAHDAGVVHRDLKPDNLFLTPSGVKILDFGLARRDPLAAGEDDTVAPTRALPTEPGTVLGTVGYMSPEQARGEPADHRSDIFSLGCVLYEMLSGRQAFAAGSGAETLAKILREDPPPLEPSGPYGSPQLESIVFHCLEKDREERFQSARDLAFDLESQTTASAVTRVEPAPAGTTGSRWRWVVATLLLAAAAAGGFLAGRVASTPQQVRYERVSFGRGSVLASRFAPDGESILFDAAWDNRPEQVFLKRPEGFEATPLGPESATLQSVSRSGELAILLEPRVTYQFQAAPWAGTLARLPIDGAVPRAILEDVTGADWAPDGRELAVVRTVGARSRLEFPPGEVLFETTGWLSRPRFSPDGELIAVTEVPDQSVANGWVTVVDRAGAARRLSARDAAGSGGLAWRPDGREVWYGSWGLLRAVDLASESRIVTRLPGVLTLGDISPDGRVLLTQSQLQLRMAMTQPDLGRPRDLTWQGWSMAMDLSTDGRKLLFYEGLWRYAGRWHQSDPSTRRQSESLVALRDVDGSPVQRLESGFTAAFSPDGRWIAMPRAGRLLLVPVEAGRTRELDGGPLESIRAVAWLPDGDRIVFAGQEPGSAQRLYVQRASGGLPEAIGREQSHLGLYLAPSTDGTAVAAQGPAGRTLLFPLSGDPERPFPGLGDGDIPIRFTDDGRGFLFYRTPTGREYEVYRLEVASGQRQQIRTLVADGPAGISANGGVLASSDGQRFVFTYVRNVGDLYLVEGLLRRPSSPASAATGRG